MTVSVFDRLTFGSGLAPYSWADEFHAKGQVKQKLLLKRLKEHDINAAKDFDAAPGCFVAGTLVHTKEGMRPIEQIKVGDMVLSKPEDGSGAASYKRVTKTFVRQSEEVFLVEYALSGEEILRSLVVTSEHPFWVDRLGWTAARNLRAGHDLVIHRDSGADEFAMVFRVQIVWDTEVPDVGWCGGTRDSDGWDREEGPTVDLRNGAVNVTQPEGYHLNKDAVALGEPLRRQVFTIEVEDFHTYYVGEAGVWVHNACPPRIGKMDQAN